MLHNRPDKYETLNKAQVVDSPSQPVPSILEENERLKPTPNRSIHHRDLTKDPPFPTYLRIMAKGASLRDHFALTQTFLLPRLTSQRCFSKNDFLRLGYFFNYFPRRFLDMYPGSDISVLAFL